MQSFKPVKSLFDLSLYATRDLVINAAKKIEENHPSTSGLSYDEDGCSEAILPIQVYLQNMLPATVHESLFQAVAERLSKTDIADKRILFKTFIGGRYNLKKMTLDYRYFSEYGSGNWQWQNDVNKILKNERHCEFWLSQMPMLSKLVDLKLNSVKNGEMILAFIRTCTGLQSLSLTFFGLSPETTLSLLHALPSFTKLQKFDYCFKGRNIKRLMTSLDFDRELTIRNLELDGVTAEQLNFMIRLCPSVVDLNLKVTPEDWNEAMQILTSCPQRFHKLHLSSENEDPMEAFRHLFTSKGIFITELTVCCLELLNHLEFLALVSETCPNLTSLNMISDWAPQDQAGLRHVIYFPKLVSLEVSNWTADTQRDFHVMLKRCLDNAPNMTSLTIDLWTYEDDEELIEMLTNNPRTKQLVDLKFTCNKLLTRNLLKTILDKCTNLKCFLIGDLTEEAKLYITGVKEEIKLKNLNISLDFL